MSAEAHCKGCGGPMTEGRAYELVNHRWHVECFRCSNCKDQLTAHTNMLVLGDGTLVCANCSYTCAVCSKKIMDMAVLTNDQAFCASCFVCRNCKKRIDDLQYARTSQGIFCMNCHNALLARKRQRQLQRQQLQKPALLQTPPQQRTHMHDLSSQDRDQVTHHQFTDGSGTLSNPGSASNPASSKSSLASASSAYRNKDLPDLPYDAGVTPIDFNADFDTLAARSNAESLGVPRQVSGGKDGSSRQLRVPRKQLAPSAFQNPELGSTSSLDDMVRAATPKGDRNESDSVLPSSANASNGSGLNGPGLNGPGSNNLNASTASNSANGSASAVSTNSQMANGETQSTSHSAKSPEHETNSNKDVSAAPKETPQRQQLSSYKLADPLQGPMSIGTPPLSPTQSEAPTPDASRTLASPGYISSDATGLSVPQRSQLRPVSPAKSLGSHANNEFPSPRNLGLRSPTHMGTPHSATASSTPSDRITASPTQAAAPQASAKSPFGRWWHKRDLSNASTESSIVGQRSSLTALPVQGHKRAISETNTNERSHSTQEYVSGSGQSMTSVNGGVTDSMSVLSLERTRLIELEKKLKQYEQRDDIQSEINNLSQQLMRLRDEHKLLTSRNNQLIEMNAELERQTLEKFGPKSLWGSQNPAPMASNEASLANASSSNNNSSNGGTAQGGYSGSKEMPKENPLVTRLDDPQQPTYPGTTSGSSTLQAQFLPFKTAKQWFFRRPNRPGAGSDRNAAFPPGQYQFTQQGGIFSTDTSGAATNGSPALPPRHTNAADGFNGFNGSSTGARYNGDAGSRNGSILGDSLSYRVQVDQAEVPYFVTRCFAEVEARGLDTEGIYRKPGSKSQVDAILEQFGHNGDPALGEELLGGEIQAVTSAVKQYLRYLAEPVITYDCYETYIAAGNSKNLQVLRKGIQSLPPENLATLRVVASHLALVASHESNNLMNTKNLAMVFAPTLARDETGEREIPDMQARNQATHMLIVNADTLLEPIDELL